jgi:hypothetical protein
VVQPARADAWFGWLDRLSGPGPFKGAEFDFRIVCFVEETPWTDAASMSVAAISIIKGRLTNHPALPRFKESLMELIDFDDGKKGANALPIRQLETLDYWTGRIANAPLGLTAKEMISVAKGLGEAAGKVRELESDPEVANALERAASSWRAATQPRVSVLPGSVAWASCSDNPKNSPSLVLPGDVRHRDRKPSPSIVLNYRQLYANWGKSTDTPFAPGNKITLRVIEPKFTWPLSGRFDFLEGQAGIGRYWFSSDGFDTFSGWIVEPVRFDVHFPARFGDDRRWWVRGLTAVSYSAGVILFPDGFPANAFNRAGATPSISGGEAIFEQGLVVNVGRLLR